MGCDWERNLSVGVCGRGWYVRKSGRVGKGKIHECPGCVNRKLKRIAGNLRRSEKCSAVHREKEKGIG
jgi:hypothetical protein